MKTKLLIMSFVVAAVVCSCGTQKKIGYLNSQSVNAQLSLTKEENESDIPELDMGISKRDTLIVQDLEGNDVLLMKAIKDEETGEMVATDILDAAVVTARFRNVAERNGKIDLAFKVTVPSAMMDSKWQIRFYPDMFIMGDSLRLEPIIITGAGFRKAQLKGYQRYDKFISSIAADSTKFINTKLLERFLKRNIPQIYAFKSDTTDVSEEEFNSYYGVSEKQAIEHYTNKYKLRLNERRKSRVGIMFKKYVKMPIVTEGIRLDTVIVADNGNLEYNYIQTISTKPKLRKVDVVLSGSIYEQDKKIYEAPVSDPLTFYISSLSSFAVKTEKYLTKVIERRAEANTEGRIDFKVGKADIDEELENNSHEIRNIKLTLTSLVDNAVFDLDSIVIQATASPEGKYSANGTLAQRRSESVSKYFESFINHYSDSIRQEAGVFFNLDDEYKVKTVEPQKIRFIPRCMPENWDDLYSYITNDQEIGEEEKETFYQIFSIGNPDTREAELKKISAYERIKELYYPRLRTVKFKFYLHRKGLVKDTVHTTVLDSVYMRGVDALNDRDYETALSYLGSYEDFNTAIVYTALDRNESALSILSGLEKTAEVNYLMAILYSRKGEIEKAVQCYIISCKQNPSFVHRGNLDPEISALIRTYQLNRVTEKPDEEF